MSCAKNAVLLSVFLLPFSCFAEVQDSGDVAEHIATIVSATPIERVNPYYPRSAAKKGQEGWSRISFVIDKEGNVIDPVVMDSSGLKVFDKAALDTAKQWKYSPAMQDGQAIEQCQVSVQMDFVLDKKQGVTRKFKTQFKQIVQAINEKQFEQAATMLEELGNSQLWNHSESAYYYLADAIYAKQINDDKRELRSLNRAVFSKTEALDNSWQLYLLERQFVLNLAQRKYVYALESFNILQKAPDNEAVLAKLSPYAQQVEQLIKSTEPMSMKANIHSEGQYYHHLSRDKFALFIDQGELDEVEIRCANKRSRFTVADGNEWQIPQSWGECTIFVTGTPDTQFQIVETGAYVSEI